MPAVRRPSQPIQRTCSTSLASAWYRMMSLESAAALNGAVASHRQPSSMHPMVMRNPGTFIRPPRRRKSTCPAMPCITAPAVRKRSALNHACVNT